MEPGAHLDDVLNPSAAEETGCSSTPPLVVDDQAKATNEDPQEQAYKTHRPVAR